MSGVPRIAGHRELTSSDSDLDALASFESHVPPTTGGPADRPAPTRYAVRQVLEAELRRVLAQRENEARQARYAVGGTGLPGRPQPTAELNGEQTDDTENKDDLQTGPKVSVKRDFFGRVITTETTRTTGRQAMQERDGNAGAMAGKRPGSSKGRPASSHGGGGGGTRVWVTFHEGLNNAVRKPLSLDELLRGL